MHELALAFAHALEHGARSLLGNVDDQALDRFIKLPVDSLIQHTRVLT